MDYLGITNELEEIEELMQEAIDKAKKLARNTQGTFRGQLEAYFIATMKAFIENENQPGSIASLKDMAEYACEEDDIEE